MIPFFSDATGFLYQRLLKPFLFRIDTELVHESFTFIGEQLGKSQLAKKTLRTLYSYDQSSLAQTLCGIHFSNPIGLAAGFDYDVRLTQILSSLGFGFQIGGTVTYESYNGNPKPMLGRLPKSQSLMVNKGFKSKGADAVIESLQGKVFPIPLGISIGSTNKTYTNLKEQIDEYGKTFSLFEKTNIPSYYEINISCPNLKVNPFSDPSIVNELFREVDSLRLRKPIFLKLFIDDQKAAQDVIKVAADHSIQGLVIGNLTKDRKNPALIQEEVNRFSVGNFSGKPTWDRSNALISYARKTFKDRFVIIGCGGVFSAEDAYYKIRLGANLIQLITGMIFQGPQLIGQINRRLMHHIQEDGHSSIKDATGTLTSSSLKSYIQ